MAASFERITGPKADVAELEYISALHQTCAGATRRTGTISSLDILRLLRSRHSLNISHAQAQDIVKGLGGGDVSNDIKRSVAQLVADKLDEEERSRGVEVQNHKRWRSAGSRTDNNTDGSTHSKDDSGLRKAELVEEMLSPKILYLDIVQLTGIILIPTLTRMAKVWTTQNNPYQQEGGNNVYASEAERVQARLVKVKEQRDSSKLQLPSIEVDADESMSLAVEPVNSAILEAALRDTSESDPFLDPQPVGLLELVLQSMWTVIQAKTLRDESDSLAEGPPLMTRQLVKSLLVENGEMERANDPVLIQKMVDSASSKSGRLDVIAFINALTSDLNNWEVGCEDRETTYVCDVFGEDTMKDFQRIGKIKSHGVSVTTKKPTDVELTGNEVERGDMSLEEENAPTDIEVTGDAVVVDVISSSVGNAVDTIVENDVGMEKTKSAIVIDSVIDSYGSQATVLLIWVTFIVQAATYAALILNIESLSAECEVDTFGCTLGKTVINWVVIALLLTGFGSAVILPLSYGNHPTKRNPCRMFTGSILAMGITLIPFLIVYQFYRKEITLPYSAVEELVLSDAFRYGVVLATVLGGTLAIVYFLHGVAGLAKQMGWVSDSKYSFVEKYTITSHIRGSARTKKAGTRKVNRMLKNARAMHGDGDRAEIDLTKGATGQSLAMSLHKSESDAVFQNYTLRGESHEETGSLVWVIDQILTGELFDTEGVWLPSRLLVFQCGQVVVAVSILLILFFVVEVAAEAADDAQDSLSPDLPDWVISLVPTGQQVRWALIPAASVSVAVCTILCLIYIPSTVKTVIKYRCGMLPSLGDNGFHIARAGPDTAYMNTANAIYGMLAAATLFFLLIGLLLFMVIWDFTRPLVILIIAWGVGLTITILIKVIMTSFCRKRFFRAFYRVQPGHANLTSLALECWHIGLGGGVLVGRITQFLLASAFWIGRIDEPFLADNVSLMGYKFDYVPLNYVKEILVHEAHRHPFLERLAAMYLMRLRYKSFGSDAGGCWRQLFVLTLMPWLMKYRVFHEQRGVESRGDQESEKEIQEDEDKEALKIMVQEILGTSGVVAGMVGKGAKVVGQVGIGTVEAGSALLD